MIELIDLDLGPISILGVRYALRRYHRGNNLRLGSSKTSPLYTVPHGRAADLSHRRRLSKIGGVRLPRVCEPPLKPEGLDPGCPDTHQRIYTCHPIACPSLGNGLGIHYSAYCHCWGTQISRLDYTIRSHWQPRLAIRGSVGRVGGGLFITC